MFKSRRKKKLARKHGIAALVIIFFITGIVTEISLTVALVSYLFGQGNFGLRASSEILAAAQSGIEDGLIRVMRRDFTTVSSKFSYSFSVGVVNPISVNVALCEGTFDPNYVNCTSGAPGQQILSDGVLLPRKRRLLATLEVDPVTRLMKISAVKEVPL